MNPAGFWLLRRHPLAFCTGVVSWLLRLGPAGYVVAVLVLPAADGLARFCWRPFLAATSPSN